MVDGYLPLTGGELSGPLTINGTLLPTNTNPSFIFENPISYIQFKNTLFFNNVSQNPAMELSGNQMYLYNTLIMKSNRIQDLAEPVNASDAATKNYVDESMADFDVQKEDLFKWGDRVCGTDLNNTEQLGFYFKSGTLYLKTSAWY